MNSIPRIQTLEFLHDQACGRLYSYDDFKYGLLLEQQPDSPLQAIIVGKQPNKENVMAVTLYAKDWHHHLSAWEQAGDNEHSSITGWYEGNEHAHTYNKTNNGICIEQTITGALIDKKQTVWLPEEVSYFIKGELKMLTRSIRMFSPDQIMRHNLQNKYLFWPQTM